MIKLIRAAEDTPTASAQLQKRFKLSERQAEAILNMRLAKLTGLEIEKLEAELREVRAFVKELRDILASRPRRMSIIRDELLDAVKRFGDERRTEITSDEGEFSIEDLIAEEDMVITISHCRLHQAHVGFDLSQAATRRARVERAERSRMKTSSRSSSLARRTITSCASPTTADVSGSRFTRFRRRAARSKGKPIVNLINVNPDTQIKAMVPVREFTDTQFLLFCTRNGTVKKSALSQYSNVRTTGIKAIKIDSSDELIDVQVTSGTNDIVLATRFGLSVRFHEQDAREMGRDTTGVRGISLKKGDGVVGMVVIKREATILVVTEKGLGKCSHIDDYRVQKRGGKGIITVNRTGQNRRCGWGDGGPARG